MVVLFCKRFPQLFSSVREMNDPVMVNQAKLFPSTYTNRVVFLCIIRSKMLKLIYILGHVLTVYLCNSVRSFQNVF